MIRFSYPQILYALFSLPILILAVWAEHRWRKRAAAKWADPQLHFATLPHFAPGKAINRRILELLALGLGIVALAGPQIGTRVENVTRQGVDLVIALDMSQSMLAEDISPNRFQKARLEVTRLLQQLRGDRVALVPFAGSAHIQVPLTLDYDALNSVLAALQPEMMPVQSTDIGEALAQALKAFSPQSPARRILLLISDGEDHMGNWEKSLDNLKKEGVIVYTIGMGSPQGVPIPIKEGGELKGYKKDRRGEIVLTKLNEELLQNIARESGGEYFRGTPGGDEFQTVRRKIEGSEKTTFEERRFTDFEHRYQWALFPAVIILMLSELLPRYRRQIPLRYGKVEKEEVTV